MVFWLFFFVSDAVFNQWLRLCQDLLREVFDISYRAYWPTQAKQISTTTMSLANEDAL